jgi:RNA polymerase sigma factor (sigma-70 family)
VSSLPSTPESAPAIDRTRWFLEEVQPHEPKVRAWLQSRFPSVRDVDDLIQEAYLRLFSAKGQGKIDHPKSYLFAMARNAALDRCRRNKVIAFERLADLQDSSVLVDATDASASDDRHHELAVLTAAIQTLPERCREVLILRKHHGLSQLILRKHHGLSHREIAERLGISPHTVNAQITIAMVKCREYFRAHGLIAGTTL